MQEEHPDAFICASHEIAPEFREFERLSTAVVNAYLGPVMRSYIERLAPRLTALGMAATPHLTQSNGGVIGFAAASEMPRSEEHTSELQSLMRTPYAVFCLKK